jgi:sulfur-carrier protein
MIQVVLPAHLRNLAGVDGPIRDRVTLRRRAFVRFFACGQDVSLDPDEAPLPEAIAAGKEPFLIIGAIAGG